MTDSTTNNLTESSDLRTHYAEGLDKLGTERALVNLQRESVLNITESSEKDSLKWNLCYKKTTWSSSSKEEWLYSSQAPPKDFRKPKNKVAHG